MHSRKKSTKRDRSIRHAFIYINILKTDLGLTFNEIANYLNDDNYRTRDGEKYTESQVVEVWNKRKDKYRMEYINHKKYKPTRSEVKAKHLILKVPKISEKPKHILLKESPFYLIEQAYKTALNEAAEELNKKYQFETLIDTKVSTRELVNSLIKVTIEYNIHPKEITDKTLNVLGGLLFHPDFPKTKKSKSL